MTWQKISLREHPTTTNPTPEDENPFENEDIKDDSAITVDELSSGMRAVAEQSLLDSDVVILPDGHMELSVDQDLEPQVKDVTKMSIEEILAEVEASGRGKRHRIKSHRYDDSYEGH